MNLPFFCSLLLGSINISSGWVSVELAQFILTFVHSIADLEPVLYYLSTCEFLRTDYDWAGKSIVISICGMNNLVVQFIFNTEWAYRAHATLLYRGSAVPESTSDTWIRQYLTLFIHSLVVHVNTEKMSRKQHGLFLLHKVTTRLETRSQTMLSSQQVSPMCSCILGQIAPKRIE